MKKPNTWRVKNEGDAVCKTINCTVINNRWEA